MAESILSEAGLSPATMVSLMYGEFVKTGKMSYKNGDTAVKIGPKVKYLSNPCKAIL